VSLLSSRIQSFCRRGLNRNQLARVVPPTKIRVAKWTVIPPRSETNVWVQSESTGLRFLQAWLRTLSNGVYLYNGIAEIVPHKPFQVRVVNKSLRERRLPKQMVLGHALPHPKGIVALVEDVAIRLYEGASFSPDRLHNRPEAARYLLTLVTACCDRDTRTLSKFS
jgi:hypothetical protein